MSTFQRAWLSGTASLGLALLLGCATAATAASSFDGSRDLLCAPSDVAECDSSGRCNRVSPSDVDLPHFMRVQFGKKRLVSQDTQERITPIESQHSADGATVLQGTQNGRAWSLVIDQQTGKLSGSVVDGEGAFLVFGACTL
jgi:hypothetical protein